jgi:bifunctional non-homologous end joining protein LigD
MSPERITIGGRTFEADNLDKVIFPKERITQGDLLDYYRRIADTILPHLQGRPLTMQRFPDGIEEQGFYQKEAPDYFPDWIRRASIQLKGEDRAQDQVVCDDAATLAYLVDQGCITLHVWESRADKLDHPDRLVFDLDPPDPGFELVRQGAQALRDTVDEVGLVPFAMTTGSRGIHIVTPLDQSASFDTARAFARDLAELVAIRSPHRFTTEMRKADRGERLFLDYLRNAYGQTSVAPYAVRAKEGAPVATPMDWDELQDSSLHAQSYTVKNILRRLGQKKDPWRDMMQHARSLKEPRERLDAAMSAT